VARRAAERRDAADRELAAIEAHLAAGAVDRALAPACALVDARPEWQAAQRAYLRALLAWARRQEDLVARTFAAPVVPTRATRISVLVCSNDPARFARFHANCERRFAGLPHEIIGIHDARSLAEGYNRAAGQSVGEILIFCHDDIELVTPDFAARLRAHLERFDGIGVAGASRVTSAHVGQAGQRHIHGHVLHPVGAAERGVRLFVAGLQQPVNERMRMLDGAFIAVRRHVWETVRFDAERYDGFHCYDADFSLRASGAGANLAVPADLLLLHQSTGRYDARWAHYARRFAAQAGFDFKEPPLPGGLQTRLDTLEEVDLLRAALVHFRYGAPVAGA
jgi:hypothetical protein